MMNTQINLNFILDTTENGVFYSGNKLSPILKIMQQSRVIINVAFRCCLTWKLTTTQ